MGRGNNNIYSRLHIKSLKSNTYHIISIMCSVLQKFVYIQMIRTQAFLTLALLLLALVLKTQTKLQVSNFAQMNPSLADPELSDIPYSIANFGFAPAYSFGKTLVAQLQQSPGLNPECTSNSSYTPSQQIQNSFLLIPRGDCQFVTKAIHAQELGAKMAIIMDNEDHQKTIIMKDNGYGYKVTIPCIFVNYKIGQKLKALLSQTKVVMKISFQNSKTQKASVILYLQSFNRQTYYFLQQFHPFYLKIRPYLTITLVYDVINCTLCSSDDCFYNGQYCSVSYEHGFSANGQMLLQQQLREQLIYERHGEDWWGYMDCVGAECGKISELKECSDRCLRKGEFRTKPDVLANQLAQSFDYNKDNAILRQNLEALRNSGVQSFPSVAINGIKVRGSLSAQFIFDDICNTLLKPPKQCSIYISEQDYHVTVTNTYWVTIIIVLVLCAVLFVALFVFCRRRMRKQMTVEMQGRVDDMVSKYIEFYSERGNRK